jgi:uncharacterized protein YndB with AHSA1/START domain
MTQESKAPPVEREIVLTRVFDAPRELVFKAWTEPERLARWWGPDHFTNPVCQIDLRPGGAIWIVMRAPDGTDYPMSGTFHEVVVPERLVFVALPEDGQGNALIEAVTTVTFAEQAGKTLVTIHQKAVALMAAGAEAMQQGMDEGWSQSLDRLAAEVTSA